MANERSWRQVSAVFTANGTVDGIVTVATTRGFKVKARVQLQSTAQAQSEYEIKAIPNSTTIIVGPTGQPIDVYANVSAFLLADNASIVQYKQKRPPIGPGEIDRATYEEEPTVARRAILVDEFGALISDVNPLPVNANVVIGGVNVDLDAFDATAPDSTLSVGSEDGTALGTRHVIRVASDGSVMARNFSGLVPEPKTKIDITSRNLNGDIASVRFFNGVSVICDLLLSYDINGDLLSVERV
jgi:hypothetical protein